jgi:predicted nuclease of predicted toxin-antitoxin system
MKFLCDQDVFASTVRFLTGLGHNVQTAFQLGLAREDDSEILRIAQEQGRILVTRDRDYGKLVFVQNCGAGVCFLRMLPATQNVVHAELERVLSLYTEPELLITFVVIEPGQHRIRKPVASQGP